MNLTSTVIMRPARSVAGSLRLPGDKSISHRYAMLAAIAEGDTRLENFSTGADCASTLGCVRALGVEVERTGNSVVIHGRGPKLQAPKAPLDCGNSGSTMRMLSGILAGQDFESELTGDESLSRRPMARIIAPLEMMGAKITAQNGGRPPLRVQRRKAESDPLRHAGGQRAGEIMSAVCRLVRQRRDGGHRADTHSRSQRAGTARVWRGTEAGREMKSGLPVDRSCVLSKLWFPAIFRARLSSSVRRHCFRARN